MYTNLPRIKDFDQAIDNWIKDLDQYSLTQLTAKPSPASWSVGQMYMHIIQATHFFMKQIHSCISNNDNLDGELYPEARSMFSNNDLPDTQLDGPPSNATTPQPGSKEQLVTGLAKLKAEIQKAQILISQTSSKGKTKHFGLGYFTADQWLQFAEMHFRHHLRQKKRLDEFLNTNNIN